jgi:hypothetical protein
MAYQALKQTAYAARVLVATVVELAMQRGRFCLVQNAAEVMCDG